MDNNNSSHIFKFWMCIDSILLFCFPCVTLFFIKSIFEGILVLLILGYLWFAFTIRIFYVYEEGIKIVFPLRFKFTYIKRNIFIPYSEIKKVILCNGRIEEIRIVLFKERNFFGKKINDYFFFWLDIRIKKRNKLLSFFKEKGIELIIKPGGSGNGNVSN